MEEIGAERTEPVDDAAVPSPPPRWSAAPLAAAGRGIAFLLASTLAASLFVFEVRLREFLSGYIARNEVEPTWRMDTLRLGAVLLAFVGLGCAALCVLKGPRIAATLERWGRLSLPIVPLVLLPPLMVRDLWRGNELGLLLLAGVFGLTFEAALRRAFALGDRRIDALITRIPPRTARIIAYAIVGTAVAYYALRISHLTIQNHDRLGTSTSDLGEFDNLFFNALHGHPFRAPGIDGDLRNWGALKIHAEFVLYLLLPFYALHPSPEALLVIQSVVVALTAVPLFAFAARRAGLPAGVVVAVVYLLLPFVERPNFYDFHFVPVGMLFVACTLCFVERCGVADAPTRRTRILFAVSFALALLSREDIAAGMIFVGLFVALSGHSPRLGYAMAGIAGTYFVIVKFLIMAKIGPSWFDAIYEDLKVPGQHGFGAVINTLLSNPVFAVQKLLIEPKLLYALHLTVPLLFLWLRSWPLLAAALPGFFFTLAVTNRPPMSESSFQYAFLWAPHIVAASALSLERLGKMPLLGAAARRAAIVALATVALAVSMHQGALLGAPAIRGGFVDKPLTISADERLRAAQLKEIAAAIPPDASVVATEQIGAHFSTRLIFYSLKYTFGKDTDYLVVGFPWIPEEKRRIHEALAQGYGVIRHLGPFFLVRRGAPPTNNGSLELEVR
jgi:uncharacterized membrane protein